MTNPTKIAQIYKTPGVCGGNARIRDTRIPVWTLISFRKLGVSNEEILRNYPSLTQQDLEAAWTYCENYSEEIVRLISEENV